MNKLIFHASYNVTEVSVEVCGHSDAGTVYERIRLEKLPYVHRAVSITMDSKGRNFGVLQADPKTRWEICLRHVHMSVEGRPEV